MVDERDKKIIDVLRRHPDITVRDLAKKASLPTSTIHRRLKILRHEGIIRGRKILLDWGKIGRPIGILVFIDVIPEKKSLQKPFDPIKNVVIELEKFDEIEEIMITEGDRDITVKARLESLKQIREFLDKVMNVLDVHELESCIITDEIYK
jgi:DNA-binding Lrp family transcriptional regulator